MGKFLEIFGLFSLILFIIIIITIIVIIIEIKWFIKTYNLSLNCEGIMTDKYIYFLPMPIFEPNIYKNTIARALLEIDLAVTNSNCPNTILAVPPGFNYLQTIYGVNPITGSNVLYAVYFYSKITQTTLISFTGTSFYSEWLEDLRFEQTKPLGINNIDEFNTMALVHTGFYKVYMSVKPQIHQLLNSNISKQVIISGHSLGGALSTLCSLDIYNNSPWTLIHYSFASPRVGNPSFVSTFNSIVTNSFRVANTEDIVPTLPPAIIESILYEHIANDICFTKNLGSLEKNHTEAYKEYTMLP